ncbi:uncharacterized protein [Venturia canescens]|uniref:uncharacterized protein n=1 Tax=Venturia canescens TaxID=32260 RepID=UPI001C9C8BF5|nr:uncharacterized protein LOC122411969 [Venturia canescens]
MSRKRGRTVSTDSEDKENDLDKRIKRLEELIWRKEKKKEKRRRRRQHSSRHSRDSSDSRRSYEGRQSQTSRQSFSNDESDVEKDLVHDRERNIVGDTQTDENAANGTEQRNETPATHGAKDMAIDDDHSVPLQVPETRIDSGDVVLDPKILEVMGKRFLEDRVLAAAIPNDLGIRWEEILKSGMPSEDRVALIKKYPPPKNCCIIDPPKMNPEVRASLQEMIIKRDERIEAKQSKIAACLAAVGKIFSNILERRNDPDNLDIFEQLSDIGRLLSDLQHDESNIRKSLILANLSAPFKEVLSGSTPDELLFGKQLEERLKAAKTLENCKRDFKATLKPQNGNNSKNSRFPPRRSQGNQRQASSAPGGKKLQSTRTQHALTNRRGIQRYENNWKTSHRYDHHRQKRY